MCRQEDLCGGRVSFVRQDPPGGKGPAQAYEVVDLSEPLPEPLEAQPGSRERQRVFGYTADGTRVTLSLGNGGENRI